MTQLSLKEVINVIMENIIIPAASKTTLIIMPEIGGHYKPNSVVPRWHKTDQCICHVFVFWFMLPPWIFKTDVVSYFTISFMLATDVVRCGIQKLQRYHPPFWGCC